MVLDLKGKVVLITGAASGIGLALVREFLQNEVKGVTLADVDEKSGEKVLKEIENEFGPNKAIFVKADVTSIQQFEDAFRKTVETFKNVDVLVNNAGIQNDKTWEKEISINLNGVIHGVLLGLENYLQKYKQGPEAVIVNMSSVAGVGTLGNAPIYGATKAALVSLTRSWSDPLHYERSKVRLIAICPGATTTPLLSNLSGRNLGEPYEEWLNNHLGALVVQEPEYLAKEILKLVENSGNGTVWVIEANEPAYEYIVPERETMKKQ